MVQCFGAWWWFCPAWRGQHRKGELLQQGQVAGGLDAEDTGQSAFLGFVELLLCSIFFKDFVMMMTWLIIIMMI